MRNRIWLITGISSGLGKALSDSVMKRGDFVIGTFRSESQVEDFNKSTMESGYAVHMDMNYEASIVKGVHEIISKFKRIDVLVNNAGIGFVGAIEEASTKEIRNVFETNFFGALKLTQEVLPYMRKEKSGHIVQISSQGGINASPGFGVYNASKFALEGFSEALEKEVASLGIKVTIVEPGPFRTNFAGNNLVLAESEINDYDSTAGKLRHNLKSKHGKQDGDPVKASDAIIHMVDDPTATLRLPLGKIAFMLIEKKLERVQSDLDINRKIAEQTSFE